jgi:hypothetical protein
MISKYFKMFLVAASALTLFTNCSKDDDPTPASENFSPLTANSTWTYKNNPGSTFTLTATNRDTVAQGLSFRVLTNSGGANNYLAKSGNSYYRFGAIAELNLNGVKVLYLKGNEAVNATWDTTITVAIPGFGTVPATLKYTIREKAATRVVGTKTFTNVTRVRLDLSVPFPITLGGGDFYYAEGIGLIESDVNVTVPGQAPYVQSQILTDYSIK